jgi:putative membrane protein
MLNINTFRTFRGAWILAVAPLAMGGCSSTSSSSNSSDASTDASADALTDAATDGSTDARPSDGAALEASVDAATDGPTLTNAQIVAVVETFNLAEIEQGLLAVGLPDGGLDAGVGLDASVDAAVLGWDGGFDAGAGRAIDPRVIAFANTVFSDHSTSNATISAFGIEPAPSTIQASLETSTQSTLAELGALSGSAFDLAYLEAQVTEDQNALNLVNQTLIPAATNTALEAYLGGTLAGVIQLHLTEAQTLLGELTDAGVDGGPDAGADASTTEQ